MREYRAARDRTNPTRRASLLLALAAVTGIALLACQQAARPAATNGTGGAGAGSGGTGGDGGVADRAGPGAGHEELAPRGGRGGCLVIGAAAA